jgi:MinD superfamily P-loop ATPase
MIVNFTTSLTSRCSDCGNTANYGFISRAPFDDVMLEEFYCTGCAHRHISKREMDNAMEEHRDLCFTQREQDLLGEIKDDHHRDMVMAGWLDYAILE